MTGPVMRLQGYEMEEEALTQSPNLDFYEGLALSTLTLLYPHPFTVIILFTLLSIPTLTPLCSKEMIRIIHTTVGMDTT